MKAGKSIIDLAAELERQQGTKRDYIADTRALKMIPDDSDVPERRVILEGVNGGMRLRPIAHQQLGAVLGIPGPYYARMLTDAPDLLSANVNRWLEKQPAKKLIRTLDGAVRAILSDKFRPLDNLDLATAVIPQLINLEAEVVSSEITDNRFYLKAITPRITGEVKKGDVIQAGLVVSNSEVGQGTLRVEALDYRLVCLNGMIREAAIRKTHVGRSNRGGDSLEDAREYFRTETRLADDRAFFLKVEDAVSGMFDPARFNVRIDQYREAADRLIVKDPIEVVEVTAKRFSFTDGEKSSVLKHFLQSNAFSQWGLANAITRTAADADAYDRATELEALGGDVIELSPEQWRVIAV